MGSKRNNNEYGRGPLLNSYGACWSTFKVLETHLKCNQAVKNVSFQPEFRYTHVMTT